MIAAGELFRILRLLLMTVKAPVYRVRHDLGRETVVLVSCLIFGGTFFYVFEDFLNVQVAALSPKLREWIAWGALVLLVIGLSGSIGWRLGTKKNDFHSLCRLGFFWGESPKIIRIYRLLWTLILLTTLTSVIGCVSQWWLVPLDLKRLSWLVFGILTIFFLAQGLAIRVLQVEHDSQKDQEYQPSPVSPQATEKKSQAAPSGLGTLNMMVRYRKNQLFAKGSFRSWGIRTSQGLVGLCGAFGLALSHSPFLGGMGSLLAGLVLASWFTGFLADDLSQSWTERGLGVTHSMYVKTLERLVLGLVLGPGICLFILVFFIQTRIGFFEPASMGSGHQDYRILQTILVALQITTLGVLPILTIPWTGLQIDGRKPGIPMMTSTILGLFIGSAILAHPLALLLVPLLRSVALPYQEGRFYRAGL